MPTLCSTAVAASRTWCRHNIRSWGLHPSALLQLLRQGRPGGRHQVGAQLPGQVGQPAPVRGQQLHVCKAESVGVGQEGHSPLSLVHCICQVLRLHPPCLQEADEVHQQEAIQIVVQGWLLHPPVQVGKAQEPEHLTLDPCPAAGCQHLCFPWPAEPDG